MPRATRSKANGPPAAPPKLEPKPVTRANGKGKAVEENEEDVANSLSPGDYGEEDDREDGDEDGADDEGADDEGGEEDDHHDEDGDAKEQEDAEKEHCSIEDYFPPGTDMSQPLYKPVGKWAFTIGKDFEHVEAIKQLSHGAQAEVWYNSAVVDGGPRFDYIAKRWSVWTEWRGFFSEIYLYASSAHLRTLQGDCVPNFIGIHNVLGGFISFAMEPLCAEGWNEASAQLSPELKDKVIGAFEKLHAKGVLHNDVELRHMLISNDQSKVMLIDFQESRSLHPCVDVGLRACTQEDLDEEMNTVKQLLDYDCARATHRRRVNRAARNCRRRVRREIKAGTFERPDFFAEYHLRDPEFWGNNVDAISDDEDPSDTEWECKVQDRELMFGHMEAEGFHLGRRFVVPTEEHRQSVRDQKTALQDAMNEQRRRRIEMEEEEAAKAAAEAGPAPKESEDAGQPSTTNASAEPLTTDGKVAELASGHATAAVDVVDTKRSSSAGSAVVPSKRSSEDSELQEGTSLKRHKMGLSGEATVRPEQVGPSTRSQTRRAAAAGGSQAASASVLKRRRPAAGGSDSPEPEPPAKKQKQKQQKQQKKQKKKQQEQQEQQEQQKKQKKQKKKQQQQQQQPERKKQKKPKK